MCPAASMMNEMLSIWGWQSRVDPKSTVHLRRSSYICKKIKWDVKTWQQVEIGDKQDGCRHYCSLHRPPTILLKSDRWCHSSNIEMLIWIEHISYLNPLKFWWFGFSLMKDITKDFRICGDCHQSSIESSLKSMSITTKRLAEELEEIKRNLFFLWQRRSWKWWSTPHESNGGGLWVEGLGVTKGSENAVVGIEIWWSGTKYLHKWCNH